jgi:hypothetical protein
VTRKIFEPEKKKIIKEYSKLHNDMLEPFVYVIKTGLDNPAKEKETDLEYSTLGRNEKYIKIFIGRPQLERPSYKWRGILTSIWKYGNCVDWIYPD